MKLQIIFMIICGLVTLVSIIGNIYLTILAIKSLRENKKYDKGSRITIRSIKRLENSI